MYKINKSYSSDLDMYISDINVSNKSTDIYKCKNKKNYTPPPAPKPTRKRLHKNWVKSRIKWENKNWNKNIVCNKYII